MWGALNRFALRCTAPRSAHSSWRMLARRQSWWVICSTAVHGSLEVRVKCREFRRWGKKKEKKKQPSQIRFQETVWKTLQNLVSLPYLTLTLSVPWIITCTGRNVALRVKTKGLLFLKSWLRSSLIPFLQTQTRKHTTAGAHITARALSISRQVHVAHHCRLTYVKNTLKFRKVKNVWNQVLSRYTATFLWKVR